MSQKQMLLEKENGENVWIVNTEGYRDLWLHMFRDVCKEEVASPPVQPSAENLA